MNETTNAPSPPQAPKPGGPRDRVQDDPRAERALARPDLRPPPSALTPPDPSTRGGTRGTPPPAEVAVGLAATAFRLGADVTRLILLPGRIAAGLPLVRGGTEALAAAGREAETRGRSRLEVAAGGLLTAPETSRTLDRALAEAMPDEAIEALAHRLLESPALERVLRDAAESRLARTLIEDVIASAELQRVVEEALAGPVRGALSNQSKTLWDEVTARVVDATARADDSAEHGVRRALGRQEREVDDVSPRYAGLASRGVALVVDLALTNLALLAVSALAGILGWLLGVSPPDVLLGVLAGSGWTLFLAGYFVLFWSTAGQTPGMRMNRLRLVGPDGRPPNGRRSLLRFAGALVALAPLGLGFAPVLLDRRRRGLHDLLARTVVVRDPIPPATTG